MNEHLRLFILSIIAGLLITGGSYFISHSEEVRCPFGALCVLKPGGLINERGFPKPYLQSYSNSTSTYNTTPNIFLREEFVFDVFIWGLLTFLILEVGSFSKKVLHK
jgi:hypothetical protein